MMGNIVLTFKLNVPAVVMVMVSATCAWGMGCRQGEENGEKMED